MNLKFEYHLQSQIAIILIVISVISQIIMGSFLTMKSRDYVIESVLKTRTASINQLSQTLTEFISFTENLSFSLILNKELQDSISLTYNSDYEDAAKLIKLNRILRNQFYLGQSINNILLKDLNGSVYGYAVEPSINELNRALELNNGLFSEIILKPFLTIKDRQTSLDLVNVIGYVKPYKSLYDQSLQGYLLIEMDYSYIEEKINILSGYYDSPVILFTKEGYQFPNKNTNEMFESDELIDLLDNSNDGIYYNKNFYYLIHKNERTGWYIMTKINQNHVIFDKKTIFIYPLILFVISLILCTFLSFKISKSITKPFDKLQKQMKKVEEGDFSYAYFKSRTIEVNKLSHDFALMVDKINHLIKQIYIENDEKNRAEMTILQNRINPHFLYNTLESIIWLARIQNSLIIADSLTTLVRLLRKNIYNKSTLISIEDELDFLKEYVTLLNFLKGSNIVFKTEIPDSLKDTRILKMIVQPFVENSISHGLLEEKESAYIKIKAEILNKKLILTITDNGKGFNQDYQTFSGIGMCNIRKRLNLYYGEEAKVDIDSKEITIVKVVIPIFEKNILGDTHHV